LTRAGRSPVCPAVAASLPLRLSLLSPSSTVGCLEDKPKEWDHPGKFKCKSCGATSDSKKKICKPTKIEKKKKG
jgi:hypothetical protein